jgi:Protein phosphatase 2C
MEIRYSGLQVPKPGSKAEQCEDAFACSPSSAIVAVCDGAGRAFESRLWARLLAEGFVENSPLGWSPGELLDWVDATAALWKRSIPWDDLDVFQEGAARSGSASTLIGLQFEALSPQATNGTWRCLAVGDSCLFQISDGCLVKALPLTKSGDFGLRTPLLSTNRNMNEQSAGKLEPEEGIWQKGDRFFLLTDAIAQWFLSEHEQNSLPAPWDILGSLEEQPFKTFVEDRQARGLMRKDDVTVFRVDVGVRQPLPPGLPPPVLPPSGVRVPADTQPPRTLTGPAPRRPKRPPVSTTAERGGAGRPGTQPTPRGRLPKAASPSGPGRVGRFTRSRAGLITGLSLVLCLGIVIGSLISRPSAQPRPVLPHVPSVQPAARRFAEQLASYTGSSAAAYNAHESALSNFVVGKEAGVVWGLLGKKASPYPIHSSAEKVSAVVVHATRSQASLEVFVSQVGSYTITIVKNTCTRRTTCSPAKDHKSIQTSIPFSHNLLINLTMVFRGGQWLVSTGQISFIEGGMFSSTMFSAGTSP